MERICRVRLAALQTRALRSKHGDCKTVIEVKKEKTKEKPHSLPSRADPNQSIRPRCRQGSGILSVYLTYLIKSFTVTYSRGLAPHSTAGDPDEESQSEVVDTIIAWFSALSIGKKRARG